MANILCVWCRADGQDDEGVVALEKCGHTFHLICIRVQTGEQLVDKYLATTQGYRICKKTMLVLEEGRGQ